VRRTFELPFIVLSQPQRWRRTTAVRTLLPRIKDGLPVRTQKGQAEGRKTGPSLMKAEVQRRTLRDLSPRTMRMPVLYRDRQGVKKARDGP
jgi:hypothetical protein